ncbi:hypothetical protein ACET3X_008048 [Alternaria dauci]|uniref:Uncharacterized protein n=1 Tax=Alternaria dauci TaxID=48095 RepID=A0ABR3U9A9_9PLEO
MNEAERQIELLKFRGLMVPTTDPATSKRPAEDSSPEPPSKKTKHAAENSSTLRYYAHLIVLQKAELQKAKEELAAEKAKSAHQSDQMQLLWIQCCKLNDRYNTLVASHAPLQTAYRDQTSELRAHKGALDLAHEERSESRKDARFYRDAMWKAEDDYDLVKKQLEQAKEDEVLQWRALINGLRSLGQSHEMGRAMYDMLLLQVERKYGEDKVALERIKEALKEAFGGGVESE